MSNACIYRLDNASAACWTIISTRALLSRYENGRYSLHYTRVNEPSQPPQGAEKNTCGNSLGHAPQMSPLRVSRFFLYSMNKQSVVSPTPQDCSLKLPILPVQIRYPTLRGIDRTVKESSTGTIFFSLRDRRVFSKTIHQDYFVNQGCKNRTCSYLILHRCLRCLESEQGKKAATLADTCLSHTRPKASRPPCQTRSKGHAKASAVVRGVA